MIAKSNKALNLGKATRNKQFVDSTDIDSN